MWRKREKKNTIIAFTVDKIKLIEYSCIQTRRINCPTTGSSVTNAQIQARKLEISLYKGECRKSIKENSCRISS